MPDDGVIYEGRKATGRIRHRSSRHRRAGSTGAEALPSSFGGKGMRRDAVEPELSHPGEERRSGGSIVSSMDSDIAISSALHRLGNEIFPLIVSDTVQLVALEAASMALQEETDRMEERQQQQQKNGRSHRRGSGHAGHKIPPPASRPGSAGDAGGGLYYSPDSASGSAFDVQSPATASVAPLGNGNYIDHSNGHHANGHHVDNHPSSRSGVNGHRRRRSRGRNVSFGQAEEFSIIPAEAFVSKEAGIEGEGGEGRGIPFRETSNAMEDEEREAMLELLNGAYSQVNELTDELKISLDKLQDTEKELKELSSQGSNPQVLPKGLLGSPTDELLIGEMEVGFTHQSRSRNGNNGKGNGKGNGKQQKGGGGYPSFLKGIFPSDEGSRSTPANVRQLQVEVQRLRQRLIQSNSREEKHRGNLTRSQRLISVMELQLDRKKGQTGESGKNAASSSDHHEAALTLVDRVAELEEKLVNCSMENATAKQDHLTAKLESSRLEKNAQRLRHELAKSQATNDLLQSEVDRLQGTISPEGEADGKGWRRWLGGLQEPLSPEPNPIRVSGGSDSPVVVVRDLDNNQLVYAPGRSQFA